MKRVTVTLDDEQADELAEVSAANGMSVSALVRSAVSRMLTDRVVFLPIVRTMSKQNGHNEHAEIVN